MNAPLRKLWMLSLLLIAGLLASTTAVQYINAGDLNADGRNSRQIIANAGRERGPITARDVVLAESVPVEDVYKFQRRYPQGEMYGNVTGHFAVSGTSTGVEQAEADMLTGTGDQLFVRRVTDLLTGKEPKGATVELTINPKVQKAAWDALGDKRGAVVAIEPSTGYVLASVTKPAFDPNLLAGHDSKQVATNYDQLNTDATKPLMNRSFGERYPPGSTFKVVVAAAALESGRYNPESVLPGPATLRLPQTSTDLPNNDGRSCGAGDQVSLADALRVSCNTAFATLGMDLGREKVAEQAQKFGFGDESIRMPNRIAKSVVPDKANKPQEALIGIGQYDVSATPMQMAMVAAAVANDGVVMRPNVVRTIRAQDLSVISESKPQEYGRAMSTQNAATLEQMMSQVVASGTGKNAQIPGIGIAGKTGTAQHAKGQAPHAWFIAFGPTGNAKDAKVAVAVIVEGGSAGDDVSGGKVAAPIAKQVIEAVLK